VLPLKRSEDDEAKITFKRMEAAWRILANQQERLDIKRWKPKTPPEIAISAGQFLLDSLL
jgi:hypothetical protein